MKFNFSLFLIKMKKSPQQMKYKLSHKHQTQIANKVNNEKRVKTHAN